MTSPLLDLVGWAPAFTLVFARVGAAMMLLPGLGEAAAPAVVKIGMALGVTVLLVPIVQPLVPLMPPSGLGMGLMIASDVGTGLWFGWLARMIALGLPMGAQFIAFQIGLSNVLQPDPELGAQASVLGKLFEAAAPVLILVSGLYRLPVAALAGLFNLIPPGHFFPLGDGTQVAVGAVGVGFSLALQLASPFVVIAVLWNLAIGLVGRIVSRLQIQFISMPGQIIAGLGMLVLMSGGMLLAWREGVYSFFINLPGGS